MADDQKQVKVYRQGVEDSQRSLFKSWLVGTVASAVILVLIPGVKDWRTVMTTTFAGGSVGFVASWLMDRRLR